MHPLMRQRTSYSWVDEIILQGNYPLLTSFTNLCTCVGIACSSQGLCIGMSKSPSWARLLSAMLSARCKAFHYFILFAHVESHKGCSCANAHKHHRHNVQSLRTNCMGNLRAQHLAKCSRNF